MNTKRVILGVATALALGASTAQADVITFNPTGTAITGVASLDWLPGAAVAIGANPPPDGIQVGTNFSLLYQASLGTILGTQNDILGISPQTTVVSGFRESVNTLSLNGDGSVTANFSFASPETLDQSVSSTTLNFFEIWVGGANFNNLAGTGFRDGTLALAGHVIGTGFTSSFTNQTPGCGTTGTCVPFDGSADGNQFPDVTTVSGNGSTVLEVVIDSLDPIVFPDLTAGSSFVFFNTSQNLPFLQVNPSQSFFGISPTIGTINGLNGTDVEFQADGNSSFARGVPEPWTLALLGLALGALGVAWRRPA